MGETFFININCSKILDNSEESQYTMCVDSTKMSTVYELTEWIRWMFSLEQCFYLVHENSVIHELEDIQFLSKLKNFEIRPCGQPNCVHKKVYRTLLDHLNLFVSWKNVKVHKYFLDKLSKMAKNLSQENLVGSILPEFAENSKSGKNSVRNSAKTDYSKFFFCDSKQADPGLEGSPLTKRQVLIDNFVSIARNSYGPSGEANWDADATEENVFNNHKDTFNSINDFNSIENKQLMADAEKRNKTLINHSSPIKNEQKVKQRTSKNSIKSTFNKSPRRVVRPFTVGEFLSNMREDFQKQNVEETNKSSNTSNNSSAVESGNFDDKIGAETNLYDLPGGRRRPRTRKRKRSKKHSPGCDEPILPFLGAILKVSNAKGGLTNPKSTSKPNHIRFDFDNDLMQTEGALNTANESELKNSEDLKEGSVTLSPTQPNKLSAMMSDTNEAGQMENDLSMNNTENRIEMASENVAPAETETKLIDFDDQPYENRNHSGNPPEIPKPLNQDLKVLLNLKEKFKSAVVIERFY